MARLTDDVKAFIVDRLACYDKPQEVADSVKEEYGVTIPRQQVEAYDPEKKRFPLAQKWIDQHAATRKAFLEQRAGLAITHRAWRQRELEDMARRAKKSRNYKLAASLLEQAAKEEGDAFTNTRAKPVAAASEEEQIIRMKGALAEMDERTVGPPAPTSPPPLTLERSA